MPEHIHWFGVRSRLEAVLSASNIQNVRVCSRDALLWIFLVNTVLSYCRSEPIEMIYCFVLWCHRCAQQHGTHIYFQWNGTRVVSIRYSHTILKNIIYRYIHFNSNFLQKIYIFTFSPRSLSSRSTAKCTVTVDGECYWAVKGSVLQRTLMLLNWNAVSAVAQWLTLSPPESCVLFVLPVL